MSKYVRGFTIIVCFVIATVFGEAQINSKIKIHFLYGSKPLAKYKPKQQKWFGGKLGGHVGIETGTNQILNFVPNGKFHLLANKKRHSKFILSDTNSFYSILGGNPTENKRLSITIPISLTQKQTLDSMQTNYLATTPFDYAFIGMRCGAAAYYLLSQINIVPSFSRRHTYLKIFYPKKLRKRLLKAAKINNWNCTTNAGSTERNWEKD